MFRARTNGDPVAARRPSAPAWLAVAFSAALCLPAAAQTPAPAEPSGNAVRSTIGDWSLVCNTPPGARAEQCALVQSVVAEDQQNIGLTVIVLKTADGENRIIRVLAPLGVLLPSGLGLKIDDADIGRAGFVRCLSNGCIAEVIMEDDLIARLKAGRMAVFIVFKTPEQGVGIPVALNGFAEGIERLR